MVDLQLGMIRVYVDLIVQASTFSGLKQIGKRIADQRDMSEATREWLRPIYSRRLMEVKDAVAKTEGK